MFDQTETVLSHLTGIGLAIGFSIYVLVRCRSRDASFRLLATSTTVDALLCFGALAGTAVFPGPGYPGLVNMLDLAGPLLATAVAGLRLSGRIALLAGGLNLVSLVALVLIDAAFYGPSFSEALPSLSAVAALLVGIACVAFGLALRTRSLARESAQRALEAERAQRNLGHVLREHHDLRTLLSSASLNADWVLQGLEVGGAPEPGLVGAARQLRTDLNEVNDFVASIKERSYAELLALRAPAPVAAREVAARIAETVGLRFPDVSVALSPGTDPAEVQCAGGADGLERVLLNLAVNACEGDGQRGATRVEIRLAREAGQVALEVTDDGPGFAAAALRDEAGDVPTTKAEGSGLGLGLVRELVEASGGTLALGNLSAGGAVVRVELPAAR